MEHKEIICVEYYSIVYTQVYIGVHILMWCKNMKGTTLNKKHREYITKGIYDEIFKELLEGLDEIIVLHIDTTFVPNKRRK